MSSDAPPSYESVVARFEQRLGSNPSPQHVLNAAKELPQYEIDILVANASKMADLTPDEEAALHAGMVKTMSSPEAASHLTNTAAHAASACNAIETMFTNLLITLTTIDGDHTPPTEGAFVPRFQILHQAFRRVVHKSKDLSNEISVYSSRFDMVIIPLCNDKDLTTEERKAKVELFINEASVFSEESNTMHNDLNRLKDDFAVFVGSFGDWATDKEGTDTDELRQARVNLMELKAELSTFKSTFYATSAVAAASLPVTGLLSLMAPQFVVPIVIGGLTIATLSTAATIALGISITSKEGEIESRQASINDLVASISDIKATREKLQLLGSEDFTLFTKNITILSMLWNSAHDDARRIKQWLESGANDVDMPKYMRISITQAANVYDAMAVYLTNYASGITAVNIPRPSS
ncbi:hypothetical protein DFH11DRAFT_1232127 [Phellopilus nigrolimitatus]|nr:hypothetical protein DFH11DRAFT_1232127 [Phellopilus nigrolimitatus]